MVVQGAEGVERIHGATIRHADEEQTKRRAIGMRMNAKCAVACAALLACTPSWTAATDYTEATVEPDGQLILHSAHGKTQAAPRISRVHGTESQVGFEKPLLWS